MLDKGSLGRALAIYYGLALLSTSILSLFAQNATPVVGCVFSGVIGIPLLILAYFYEHNKEQENGNS